MQIVIDIPHSLYANLSKIKHETIAGKRILECVKNGTPLPKGHGRLIDADALNISHGVFMPLIEGNTLGCAMDAVFADEIDDAPAIIEADKAEQEDATR
mgnify:CR=1 FL=1